MCSGVCSTAGEAFLNCSKIGAAFFSYSESMIACALTVATVRSRTLAGRMDAFKNVIPAKAGIQNTRLDPGLRRGDDKIVPSLIFMVLNFPPALVWPVFAHRLRPLGAPVWWQPIG